MRLVPRDYQAYGNKKLFDFLRSGEQGNPLTVMPTGTGKALSIADFIWQMFQRFGPVNILMLAPTKELVQQNYDELKEYWPEAPVGILCSGLNRFEPYMPIVFGTPDTVEGREGSLKTIQLILVDECHRIAPKDDGRYMSIYIACKKRYAKIRLCGWTATDYRQGLGRLTDPGGIFSKVLVDMTTMEAYDFFFKQGYLLPPVSKGTDVRLSDVKKISAGDYNQKELQEKFDEDVRSGVIDAALDEALAIAEEEGRKHWLVFVPGIADCEYVAGELNARGISATFVHSKLSKGERDRRIRDYKAGIYTAMVNNGILTTGFNFKALDLIVVLRKTNSASLWVQILGRGTRPDYAPGFDITTFEGRWAAILASDKQNCRVLDFADNASRLGPINDPVKPKKPGEKKGGDAPIKECPTCGTQNATSVRNCFMCGHEFVFEIKIEASASTVALVKEKEPVKPITEWWNVERVTYNYHGFGQAPNMRVNYYTDNGQLKEHVCFQHEGPIANKAKRWWKERGGENPPSLTSEALERVERELKVPSRILVWTNTKPKRIMNYDYES